MNNNQVIIAGYAHSSVVSLNANLDDAPELRRASYLQKAAHRALNAFKEANPDLWLVVSRTPQACLQFATSLGEIYAIADVTKKVVAKDYLVSPITFQNSVANSATGLLSRVHKLNMSSTTWIGNWLCFDEMLRAATFRLGSGLEDVWLVVHADEAVGEQLAVAEVFVAASPAWAQANGLLSGESYWLMNAKKDNNQHVCQVEQATCRFPMLNLHDRKLDFVRVATDSANNVVKTYFDRNA
jgi:hypothetical protein